MWVHPQNGSSISADLSKGLRLDLAEIELGLNQIEIPLSGIETTLQSRETLLVEIEKSLNLRDSRLNTREANLSQREQELNVYGEDLVQREAASILLRVENDTLKEELEAAHRRTMVWMAILGGGGFLIGIIVGALSL